MPPQVLASGPKPCGGNKGFIWELLDRVIYKTLYGNPLDFSKIYDIVMSDEITLTYLLLSVYLSVLCSLGPFGAI